MIVYRDLISGDEMLSDAFKLLPVVDKDGATVRENIHIYIFTSIITLAAVYLIPHSHLSMSIHINCHNIEITVYVQCRLMLYLTNNISTLYMPLSQYI